jgi:HK97 family phage prohead protease
MSLLRKVMPAVATQLEANRTRVIASTNQLARDGHIVEPSGLQTENFLRGGTILFDHDPKTPVATPVSAGLTPEGSLSVDLEWAPEGISADADRIRGLVKAGVLRAVSIGFEPIDAEPLDPARPRAGLHIRTAELLELSFVTVPADTGALVTNRSDATDWKCGASQDLPIEDSDAWDGAAAEASIFEWAGGDNFDPTKVRKGFLAYNAAKPKERGSYRLPIAHVVDGRMKVPKGALRAAASRLPQADIPDGVKESARKVLDHYEEKAGMAESDKDRGFKAKFRRALERAPRVPSMKRGLYEVASLAYQLEQLGYAHSCAEWETEVEGDNSPVPGMLGEALVKLGEAFIAMSKEEATELLAGKDLEIDEDAILVEERAYVAAGKTPVARAWRAGVAMARAGKALSASNSKKLEDAQGHHERALKHLRALGDHHQAIAGNMDAITTSQEKAQEQQAKVGEALQAAKNEPEKAADHVARAVKANKAAGAHLADAADAHATMADGVADAGDSHAACTRSVKSAQRCVRAVVEGSTPGAEDGDSKEVQTSAGDEDSAGAANGRSVDFRTRRAELAKLATPP